MSKATQFSSDLIRATTQEAAMCKRCSRCGDDTFAVCKQQLQALLTGSANTKRRAEIIALEAARMMSEADGRTASPHVAASLQLLASVWSDVATLGWDNLLPTAYDLSEALDELQKGKAELAREAGWCPRK